MDGYAEDRSGTVSVFNGPVPRIGLYATPKPKLWQLAGGWKSHATVLLCCQHAEESEMREALQARRRA